ncbi:MAG: hypothetical protein H6Q18_530 [Bacteroidetes bacterium]|nr:hypothetical protein [Bacteroidota bacterium]
MEILKTITKSLCIDSHLEMLSKFHIITDQNIFTHEYIKNI